MMAIAKRRTISRVPYSCEADLSREGGCSTTFGAAGGAGAGIGEVAIVFRRSSAPSRMNSCIFMTVYGHSQLFEFAGPRACAKKLVNCCRLACDECLSSRTVNGPQLLLPPSV